MSALFVIIDKIRFCRYMEDVRVFEKAISSSNTLKIVSF